MAAPLPDREDIGDRHVYQDRTPTASRVNDGAAFTPPTNARDLVRREQRSPPVRRHNF